MMADEAQTVDTGADTSALDSDNRPQLTEIEQVAVEMGWDPNHQSADGKPGRTARDWVLSADRMSRNQKREIADLKKSIDRIVVATDKQVQREVEQRAREIEERFAEAVENKDTKGAAQAATDMRQLEAEQKKAAPAGETDEDRFARDNTWYGVDEDATAYAVSISQREAGKGATPAQQLKAVEAAVRKRFPEHFEAKPNAADDDDAPAERQKRPTLNAPGRPVGRVKTQNFGDMPDVARNAASRVYDAMKMRNGDKVPDRKAFEAQYAKDYFADQAA